MYSSPPFARDKLKIASWGMMYSSFSEVRINAGVELDEADEIDAETKLLAPRWAAHSCRYGARQYHSSAQVPRWLPRRLAAKVLAHWALRSPSGWCVHLWVTH